MVRYFLPFLAGLILVVVALVSCLSAEEGELRALPRIVWVPIILLFPVVGPIAYLVAGRPLRTASARQAWRPGNGFPEAERPRPREVAPDDDPEFLRTLRAQDREDVDLLKKWEEDLRRREEELRRQRDQHPDGEPPH